MGKATTFVEVRACERDGGRVVATLWLDPGDASPELIADFFTALSDFHVAHGGKDLKFVVPEAL